MKGTSICMLLLCFALCIMTGCSLPAGQGRSTIMQKGSPTIQKGDFAPDLLGVSLDGHEVHLSGFKGKVVVLIFWKTWCNACRKELIEMKSFLHEYGNRFILLAINIGEPYSDVRIFKRHFLLDFTILLDPGTKISSAYGIHVWPTTVLIDQEGRVYWTSIDADVELLRREVESLLAEGK